MQTIAVIDIGKTNGKLAIVNAETQVESEVFSTPNAVIDSNPYPHFDVTSLRHFLLQSLKSAAESYEIAAITFTTHGACAALLDKHGELATPILDYEYEGPNELSSNYRKIRPDFESTGSPYLNGGLNVGAQLYWLFEQDNHLLDRVKTILMYPQYWAYQFCGVMANEPTSLGCHTDLWNPLTADFSTLTDTLRIRDKMAEVKPASTLLGKILPEIAEATGVNQNTPVYCGIHDSNASLLAHLKRVEGPFSVVSTGTWVVCMSPGGSTEHLDESKDTLLNVSALGKPTPSSRFMGGREYDYLINTYHAVETDLISQHVVDSQAMILPAIENSSGPYQNCQYRWTADPLEMTPQDRYCVVSLYLAMMTASCLGLCPADGPIIVEGPFARNRIFCTMLGAATGRAVTADEASSTGTSIGAALLVPQARNSGSDSKYVNLASNKTDNQQLANYSRAWQAQTRRHALNSQ